jgi:hypothetical protein
MNSLETPEHAGRHPHTDLTKKKLQGISRQLIERQKYHK